MRLAGESPVYAEGVRKFSPGFALKPWGRARLKEDATLRGLHRRPEIAKGVATPSELRVDNWYLLPEGFKANPGLELANAIGVSIPPSHCGQDFKTKPLL